MQEICLCELLFMYVVYVCVCLRLMTRINCTHTHTLYVYSLSLLCGGINTQLCIVFLKAAAACVCVCVCVYKCGILCFILCFSFVSDPLFLINMMYFRVLAPFPKISNTRCCYLHIHFVCVLKLCKCNCIMYVWGVLLQNYRLYLLWFD